MSEDPNIDLARRLLAALEAVDEEPVAELIHPVLGASMTKENP
jgi:hypothetical protein